MISDELLKPTYESVEACSFKSYLICTLALKLSVVYCLDKKRNVISLSLPLSSSLSHHHLSFDFQWRPA